MHQVLKGGTVISKIEDAFDFVRTLPHDHVATVLGTIQNIGLERLIDTQLSPMRNRVLAMIGARIILPNSNLGKDLQMVRNSLEM